MNKFLLIASATMLASASLAAETVAPVEFYASVYSTNSWKEHNFDEPGMYRFSTDKYSRTVVRQDPDIDASGGGAMTDDFYFCTKEYNFGSWVEVTHYIINPDTWITTSSLRDGDQSAVATDMTYDPVTAKIYGCFNGDDENGPMVFGTLDEGTGERFAIADIEVPWIACSVDRSGNLYAVDMAGDLFAVNKVNGASTKLGNLGFTASNRSTGAIDPRTGIFYVVVTNSVPNPDEYFDFPLNESSLYAVDIAAAKATFLYEFEDGEALGGMFIPGPAAEDGAPAQVEDLVLNFPNGSLSGTVEFTVPATTFDGNPASGTVTYLARANGSLLAQGTAAYGEKVVAPASVAEAAMYDVELMLNNSAGRSPKTKLTTWLGEDSPEAISNVALMYADGRFNLSWTAPAGSVHGGYYDPAKITYTVTRKPDGIKVAEGLNGTSFSEAMDVPEEMTVFSYDVAMVYDVTTFMPVSSNIWRLGSVSLPYTATFEDDDALSLFTVLDLDGDRIEWYREWEFYIESTDELIPAAVYPYSSGNGANDWLMTPPMALKAGREYRLGFSSLTDYEGDEPMLEIYLGQAPEASAMTQQVMAPMAITTLLPESHGASVSVPADGIYYIGFHACSEEYRSAIAITEITLAEATPAIDLGIVSLEVPESFATHAATELVAKVKNFGTSEVSGATVTLSRNGEAVANRVLGAIAAGAEESVVFMEMLTPFHGENLTYAATVECAGDSNDANNTSDAVASAIRYSANASVGDLSGSETATGVELTWTSPAAAPASRAAGAVTESFETYESFAIDGAGDWKFVSLDDTPANEMELASLPHLGTGEDIAYMVLDATGIDESFAAYTGSKCLMAVWNDEYNDDWVISPELSGDAQTVTFMGRSYDDYYLENIAVMYSTTDSDINSFNYLPEGGVYDEISAEWTRYSFDLPAGAKYFAIGYVSECCVAFLLDDITYQPAGGASTEVKVIGFNVYRDGVKLNDAPVAESTYTDLPDAGSHPVYHVTAVYDDGESRLSNPFELYFSGVNGFGTSESDLDVASADGELHISSATAQPFAVYAADGRQVAAGTVTPGVTATVSLNAGIYVVRGAQSSVKALVR